MKKGQAVCPQSIAFNSEQLKEIKHTEIRWLGGGGVVINSRGTILMIDPVLEGFDLPLLYKIPIKVEEVQNVDGILITHIDNDHFSIHTCKDLRSVCKSYHGPHYVADCMKASQIDGTGHDINEQFQINDINIKLTKVVHHWQNGSKKYQFREWKIEDYCGYYLNTKDGKIWMPGDSKLIDEQLHMEAPDVILFDFSDNEWHITLDGAIQLANAYPQADLICIHWGSVDAPTMSPFNGNPLDLFERVVNPQRIKVLAPGEAYALISH